MKKKKCPSSVNNDCAQIYLQYISRSEIFYQSTSGYIILGESALIICLTLSTPQVDQQILRNRAHSVTHKSYRVS